MAVADHPAREAGLARSGCGQFRDVCTRLRDGSDEGLDEVGGCGNGLVGPAGQKKRFMDVHPGATDKYWETFDRAQVDKKRVVSRQKGSAEDED